MAPNPRGSLPRTSARAKTAWWRGSSGGASRPRATRAERLSPQQPQRGPRPRGGGVARGAHLVPAPKQANSRTSARRLMMLQAKSGGEMKRIECSALVGGEIDERGVFEVRTHDLNAHRQPGHGPTGAAVAGQPASVAREVHPAGPRRADSVPGSSADASACLQTDRAAAPRGSSSGVRRSALGREEVCCLALLRVGKCVLSPRRVCFERARSRLAAIYRVWLGGSWTAPVCVALRKTTAASWSARAQRHKEQTESSSVPGGGR